MKTFRNIILLIFVLTCVSFSVQASFSEIKDGHIQFPYEIGVSNGIVYSFSEEQYAYGLHVYFIKKFGISKKLGIGAGYEAIFDGHSHNTVCVLLHYTPFKHISVNVAPGLVFLESEPDKSRFALHTEILYEFHIGVFNIGPSIGAAFNPDDFHTSVGVHLAVGF
ncbi:MAG: hypothetical protein KAR57_00170 [Bacteroidales bacterium]|nr:hypothetical protein [Bacteroidales bacterium]